MAERPKGYGMTAELREKQDAKHDPQMEQEAKEWLTAVAGEPFPEGSFHEALKNGVYLCKVINILQPGSVPKVNQSKMAFKMMENIGNFLDACERYGCNKQDIFQTVDLYEAQNMPQVINGIHALGRKAQTKPGYSGPPLGAKESQQNVREFDEQTLKAGQAVIGLQMGSNKGASQAGSTPYGAPRQIH